MGMREQLLSLVVKTSVDLPHDVEGALEKALSLSEKGSGEEAALRTMLSNAAMAREKRMPICQDTGTLMFGVEASSMLKRNDFQEAAEWAVAEATRLGVLRQNCVNSLTGKNTGNNLGVGSPVVLGPAVTREQSPAFLRNSNGRLDFPGPTQEAC